MKFTTTAIILAISSLADAMPQGAYANRPVPTGSCCVANTSLKQDVCNVNGQSGRCVPDNNNNCKSIQSTDLTRKRQGLTTVPQAAQYWPALRTADWPATPTSLSAHALSAAVPRGRKRFFSLQKTRIVFCCSPEYNGEPKSGMEKARTCLLSKISPNWYRTKVERVIEKCCSLPDPECGIILYIR